MHECMSKQGRKAFLRHQGWNEGISEKTNDERNNEEMKEG